MVSSPKKSVTVTLLPLPATRRSSLTSNKKIFGILKNTNIASSQNQTENNKLESKTSNKDVIYSVPDLIRNVPAKQIDSSEKGSFIAVEKWLPFVKAIHPLETELSSHLKRDSFSDETASSVTSYASPCGELSFNSTSEDARWSSTTSGYESDETVCNPSLLAKSKKPFIPRQTLRNKKNQAITTPWLNFKEINFQNVEILTEKEISTLNARLERLFDVYKKMERNRSVKNVGNSKTPSSGNKYTNVKAKVQSNAPLIKNGVSENSKQSFLCTSRSFVEKQQKLTALKSSSKKESPINLKILKNCFLSSKSPTSLQIQTRNLSQENKEQIRGITKHPTPEAPNLARVFHKNVIKQTNISSNKASGIRKGMEYEEVVSQSTRKSREQKTNNSRPQSPVLPKAEVTISKMANFKCPRVKQRCSASSIERKLNLTINTSPVNLRREGSVEEVAEVQHNRRSNPALLNMKLPKRLSRTKLEQVKRLSSRSLVGQGLFGSSTFGEKWRSNELARSQDSDFGIKICSRGGKRMSQVNPWLGTNSLKKHSFPPTSFSSSVSSVQSLRRLRPKEIRNGDLAEKYLIGRTSDENILKKTCRLNRTGNEMLLTVATAVWLTTLIDWNCILFVLPEKLNVLCPTFFGDIW